MLVHRVIRNATILNMNMIFNLLWTRPTGNEWVEESTVKWDNYYLILQRQRGRRDWRGEVRWEEKKWITDMILDRKWRKKEDILLGVLQIFGKNPRQSSFSGNIFVVVSQTVQYLHCSHRKPVSQMQEMYGKCCGSYTALYCVFFFFLFFCFYTHCTAVC